MKIANQKLTTLSDNRSKGSMQSERQAGVRSLFQLTQKEKIIKR